MRALSNAPESGRVPVVKNATNKPIVCQITEVGKNRLPAG